MKLLELQNIGKTFTQGEESLEVLKNINLSVDKGDLVALVGDSGSGKSTLLHIAGLLETASRGEIKIERKSCNKISDRKRTLLRRRQLGFIYQYHHLLADFSALENVMIPMIIANKDKKQAKAEAENILIELGLADRIEHRPAALSGGEKQRVAIARAVANNPKILLADEPTGNLDPTRANQVIKMFFDYVTKHNMAAIIVTHNEEIAAKCKKTYRLEKGVLK